jgi:hypothetical protein
MNTDERIREVKIEDYEAVMRQIVTRTGGRIARFFDSERRGYVAVLQKEQEP